MPKLKGKTYAYTKKGKEAYRKALMKKKKRKDAPAQSKKGEKPMYFVSGEGSNFPQMNQKPANEKKVQKVNDKIKYGFRPHGQRRRSK